MAEKILHSFEAGRRGKPDELDSGLAHLIGAHFLEADRDARFDVRVAGSYSIKESKPLVRVSGEVSEALLGGEACKTIPRVVADHYNFVHRTTLKPDDFVFDIALKPQALPLASNGNAGDSGNPIAVAYRDTPNRLPWERHIAVGLRDTIDDIFHKSGQVPERLASASGIHHIQGLRADGKVGVDVLYEGAQLIGIPAITLAVEHDGSMDVRHLRHELFHVVSAYLDIIASAYCIDFGVPIVVVNGNGAWNAGGWRADEGSREAKPHRDGFGSYGVAEDSFSGEDPTKPSGTGTFLARYIAVQIVGNGLADFARVALRYTIGEEDVGLNVSTLETGKLEQRELEKLVRGTVGLRIKDAIGQFGLREPALYRQIVCGSDFFHDPELLWNKIDTDYTAEGRCTEVKHEWSILSGDC